MPINREKYQEAILYLCRKLGGEIRGKKKLAKLLYFADFDYFEKFGRPITGDVYTAKQMGPFPTALDEMTNALQEKGELRIDNIEEYGPQYVPTEVYHCAASQSSAIHLSDEERSMLDRITKKYGGLNGKQLEDLSHNEAPYVATEPTKEIPYELAYYRGTDFSEV